MKVTGSGVVGFGAGGGVGGGGTKGRGSVGSSFLMRVDSLIAVLLSGLSQQLAHPA
jgi:hypothetical protein